MDSGAGNNSKFALKLYIILAGIFISSLVAGNLIFQKFFSWSPFTFLSFNSSPGDSWHSIVNYTFQISVGIIPYPVTFLITDIISEIYGRKKANYVVYAGLLSTLFIFIVILFAEAAPATDFSPVSNSEFTHVFGLTGAAVTASMIAYLLAQLVDIRIFHFWKVLTKGKMLWLRNNFSTITSQFIDTSVVLILLCYFEVIPWSLYGALLLNGFLFKVLIALLDTPVFYLVTALLRKRFNLKPGEEINYF